MGRDSQQGIFPYWAPKTQRSRRLPKSSCQAACSAPGQLSPAGGAGNATYLQTEVLTTGRHGMPTPKRAESLLLARLKPLQNKHRDIGRESNDKTTHRSLRTHHSRCMSAQAVMQTPPWWSQLHETCGSCDQHWRLPY